MVSAKKKAYMKEYNSRPEVKARKAAYMRALRAQRAKQAAAEIVKTFLNFGYENLAFEYAKECCPELLLTVKASTAKKKNV
ncbi:MAG: hypothetical protein ACP5IJ_01275 [Candidatus Nanoarchaeia archaeon]